MDVLADLNPAQREAVETINGPVLILAGPGSGKTRVITHRVAYLIKVCGVSPRRVLAVTFTNKAAREMESRLLQLAGESVGQMALGTFHALCARFLRQDGGAIGVNPRFVIYDAADQLSLVKRAMQAAGIDHTQYSPGAFVGAISNAKNQLMTPDDYERSNRSYFEELVGRTYQLYQRMLVENDALDFDDLLMKAATLFRDHADVRARYQSRYLYIMVDEFQDTNLVQYELVKLLGGEHKNVCVVGDPDQSIYSWRAADLRNILNFEHDYPNAKVVLLEQNYRSTKVILDAAANVISANQQRKQKGLWTENEQGEAVRVVETYTEQEEAQFVVSEVERLVDSGDASLGDCAVMYRTNAQSRVIEEAFIRYGIPYKLVAGTRFYERREVKDVVAYLRLIHNPQDSVSLRRIINVPGRGIGQQTMMRLSELAESLGVSLSNALRLVAESRERPEAIEHPFNQRTVRTLADFQEMIEGFITKAEEVTLTELFDLVVEVSGYRAQVLGDKDGEERWENVLELRGVAHDYQHLPSPEAMTSFLEKVSLVSDTDGYDETTDRVTLITLHQAKGLEFPVVFIVGLEERLLPHVRSFDDPAQMEEERRLFYVGITRARKHLYLVHSFRRTLMGTSGVNQPSRYIDDIPKHLTAKPGWWRDGADPVTEAVYSWNPTPIGTTADAALKTPKSSKPSPELRTGDRVVHAQFGEGVVVSCKDVRDDREVVVAFDGQGVKRLLMSFARLEKVG